RIGSGGAVDRTGRRRALPGDAERHRAVGEHHGRVRVAAVETQAGIVACRFALVPRSIQVDVVHVHVAAADGVIDVVDELHRDAMGCRTVVSGQYDILPLTGGVRCGHGVRAT